MIIDFLLGYLRFREILVQQFSKFFTTWDVKFYSSSLVPWMFFSVGGEPASEVMAAVISQERGTLLYRNTLCFSVLG